LAICTPQKWPGGQAPPQTNPSSWNVQGSRTIVLVVVLLTVVVVTCGSVVVDAQSAPPVRQQGRQISLLVSRHADLSPM